MQVIPLFQSAAVFLRAAVADIRRIIKPCANFFLIRRANTVVAVAERTPPCTVRLVLTKLAAVAVPAIDTTVVRIVGGKFFTLICAFSYLAGNGGGAFAETLSDEFQRTALSEKVFNLQTFLVCQMFVLCHVS